MPRLQARRGVREGAHSRHATTWAQQPTHAGMQPYVAGVHPTSLNLIAIRGITSATERRSRNTATHSWGIHGGVHRATRCMSNSQPHHGESWSSTTSHKDMATGHARRTMYACHGIGAGFTGTGASCRGLLAMVAPGTVYSSKLGPREGVRRTPPRLKRGKHARLWRGMTRQRHL